MYVLLEYTSWASVWLTVLLEMIVLLEYIDLLVIQGCKNWSGLYNRTGRSGSSGPAEFPIYS